MGCGAMRAHVGAWALAFAIAGAGFVCADDDAVDVSVGSAPASGMRAYVDPGGRLTEQPPATAPPRDVPPAQSRSPVGLVETRAPGGGSMIDLQGRFQSPLVATVEPDGTLHMRHVDGRE